jgi:hypothetical protein
MRGLTPRRIDDLCAADLATTCYEMAPCLIPLSSSDGRGVHWRRSHSIACGTVGARM